MGSVCSHTRPGPVIAAKKIPSPPKIRFRTPRIDSWRTEPDLRRRWNLFGGDDRARTRVAADAAHLAPRPSAGGIHAGGRAEADRAGRRTRGDRGFGAGQHE